MLNEERRFGCPATGPLSSAFRFLCFARTAAGLNADSGVCMGGDIHRAPGSEFVQGLSPW